MNSFILILLLIVVVVISTAIDTLRTYKGEVVARVANGYLVKLDVTEKLVYVQGSDLCPGNVIEMMHPWLYKLKHIGEHAVTEISVPAGIIDKNGKYSACLQERVGVAQWLGMSCSSEVFIDVENDDSHYAGEHVAYSTQLKFFDQFYQV